MNNYFLSTLKSGPKGQFPLLRMLATAKKPLSADRLFEQAGLSETEGRASLDTLRQHDVVAPIEDDVYDSPYR